MYDINDAFTEIEDMLIQQMNKKILKNTNINNLNTWQLDQLKAMYNFKNQNEILFAPKYRAINKNVEAMITETYNKGLIKQAESVLVSIVKGNTKYTLSNRFRIIFDELFSNKPLRIIDKAKFLLNGIREDKSEIKAMFYQVNNRQLRALIDETNGYLINAENAILRRTEDAYREIIFKANVGFQTGSLTVWQAVDVASKDFLSKGINCIRYRDGRTVNIASYAEMCLRTANTKAYLAGEGTMREEWGIHTVYVSSHGACSNICRPFQGRVYIDNVYSGGYEGESNKYPSLSSAMAGGLFHPNCKHTVSTFFEDINEVPNEPTRAETEETARKYELQQKQRYNERQIRKYKRLESGSLDINNKKNYNNKLKEWQKTQRDFISNNKDVLRRDYQREKLR